jgi:hypothetical protein
MGPFQDQNLEIKGEFILKYMRGHFIWRALYILRRLIKITWNAYQDINWDTPHHKMAPYFNINLAGLYTQYGGGREGNIKEYKDEILLT